jgi:hypothetical protein
MHAAFSVRVRCAQRAGSLGVAPFWRHAGRLCLYSCFDCVAAAAAAVAGPHHHANFCLSSIPFLLRRPKLMR